MVSTSANLRTETAEKRIGMVKQQSPIGTSVQEHIALKRSGSKRYREAQERLQPFEQSRGS